MLPPTGALRRLERRGLLGGRDGPLALHPPLAARVARLERLEPFDTARERNRSRPDGRSGD